MDENLRSIEPESGNIRFGQIENKLFKLKGDGQDISCLSYLTDQEKIGLIASTFNIARGSLSAQSIVFRYVGRIFDTSNPDEIIHAFTDAYESLEPADRLAILSRAPKDETHNIDKPEDTLNLEIKASLNAVRIVGSTTDQELNYVLGLARSQKGNTLHNLTALAAFKGCYAPQGAYQAKSEAFRINLEQKGAEISQAASAASF